MSQMNTPGTNRPRPDADSDVYTVLIVVAFLFVLVATIFVAYRASQLYEILPPAGLG